MTVARRRVAVIVGATAVALVAVAAACGTFLWLSAGGRMDRRSIDAIDDRDPDARREDHAGPRGTQFLVVGSDSREELSEEQRRELATGGASGGRADTILLVQVRPSGGRANVVSFPRDLRVDIPGYGADRIKSQVPPHSTRS